MELSIDTPVLAYCTTVTCESLQKKSRDLESGLLFYFSGCVIKPSQVVSLLGGPVTCSGLHHNMRMDALTDIIQITKHDQCYIDVPRHHHSERISTKIFINSAH